MKKLRKLTSKDFIKKESKLGFIHRKNVLGKIPDVHLHAHVGTYISSENRVPVSKTLANKLSQNL